MLKNDQIMEKLSIEVNASIPIIKTNFGPAQKQLDFILEKYDLIVDESSVKTAKKMATELNKMSKQIDTLRKEKIAELTTPIKEFEEEAKALSAQCQESRKNLLSQVKVFEDKEIEKAKELLNKELNATYEKYEVGAEFQNVKVLDLAIISNLNKSGLAKKAKDAIDERVLEAKRFQEKIDTRLLTLEAICFKGGLQAPLTRENINHFLMIEDDDIYLEKLVSLIQNEIARIDAMKEREAQREQPQPPIHKVIQQQHTVPTQLQEPKTQEPSKYDKFKNNEFAPKSTKKAFTVTAVFEVEVDERLGSRLEAMLLNKFAKSGFKTIPTISVEGVRHVS